MVPLFRFVSTCELIDRNHFSVFQRPRQIVLSSFQAWAYGQAKALSRPSKPFLIPRNCSSRFSPDRSTSCVCINCTFAKLKMFSSHDTVENVQNNVSVFEVRCWRTLKLPDTTLLGDTLDSNWESTSSKSWTIPLRQTNAHLKKL